MAFAAIPDAGGVIHGCYNKTSGTLRVTDTQTNVPQACSTKEQALNWSQQGPKGDPGLPGPKGDAGPKGDTGPSDAYFDKPDSAILGGGATVATEWLPVGQYVIEAKGDGASYFSNQPFSCTLGAGPAEQDATAPLKVTDPSLRVPFSLLIEHSSNQGGWVTLDCAGTVAIEHINLTAIKVGQLHAW